MATILRKRQSEQERAAALDAAVLELIGQGNWDREVLESRFVVNGYSAQEVTESVVRLITSNQIEELSE